MNDIIIIDILNCLNLSTLQKIKNKCESYITYCIDYKQVNAKFSVKTKQKDYLELLEQVNNAIIVKQFETEKTEKANSASSGETNITSTMADNQVESNKKEKKK